MFLYVRPLRYIYILQYMIHILFFLSTDKLNILLFKEEIYKKYAYYI